jgi:hypothetical protein
MYSMLKLLRDKKTKLVLYTYDSFLFSVEESELDTMKEIEDIFTKNKLYISRKKGYDYYNLEDF